MTAIKTCGADCLNYGTTVTSTTYTPTTGSTGMIRFNMADFDGTVAVYLEFNETISYSGVLDAYADGFCRLYDFTNSASVTGSEVEFSSSGRKRSGNISSYFSGKGDVSIYLQIKAGNGFTTVVVYGWRIVVIQSGTISKICHYVSLAGNDAVTGTTYAEEARPKKYAYDGTLFDGTKVVIFAATLVGDGTSTMYAELYDKTANAAIGSTEVSTASATEVFLESGNIAGSLTNGNELTTYVKRANGSQGIIRNAFLIIEQTGINNGTGKFQSVMQITNNYRTSTSTTYDIGLINNYYDPSDWTSATIDFKGEYIIKRTAFSGTPNGRAHLTDDTVEIDSSEVITTNTSYERKTSGSLTPPSAASLINDGIKIVGTGTSPTVYITSARVLLTITALGYVPAGGVVQGYMQTGKYWGT